MEPITIGLIGIGVLVVLLFAGVPIAFSMAVVGIGGTAMVVGLPQAMSQISLIAWDKGTDFIIVCIPLFIFMGQLTATTGIAGDLYDCLQKWLSRRRGGLAVSSVLACGGFGAVTGSSVACVATMGTIVYPEMKKYGYDRKLATGVLAASGTLGILIPPSINLLVYGSLANVSVGQLFLAGVLPGILLTLLFSAYILVAYPKAGSAYGVAVPRAEKIALLKHLVPPLVIFGIVMGSIYGGFATPTESAALGVIAALWFVWRNGRLTTTLMSHCFIQSARTTGMVILVIVCALLLNVTLSMTGGTQAVTRWVTSLGLSQVELLLVLVLFYVVLGMFLDAMSMLVLTTPIVVPMVVALGVDPIWFGIFVVVMCEIGLITPPVGMNLFVVQGVRRSGNFNDVIWGAFPFVLIMIAFAGLLITFPDIALILPQSMSGR